MWRSKPPTGRAWLRLHLSLGKIEFRFRVDTMSESIRLPHHHISHSINLALVLSRMEGGFYLPDLAPNHLLEVETANRIYVLMRLRDGAIAMWGHPRYCPRPVLVKISGSTWGGSMLKLGFIGRGMHMEFRHPSYSRPITTSTIRAVREIQFSSIEPKTASPWRLSSKANVCLN